MPEAERDAALQAVQQDVAPAFVIAAPVLMVVFALIGLMVIVGLHWAWRRSDRRWRGEPRKSATPEATDIWRESGRRATGDDKPPTKPVRPSIPEDLTDDDSPSDWTPEDEEPLGPDDDDEPWR